MSCWSLKNKNVFPTNVIFKIQFSPNFLVIKSSYKVKNSLLFWKQRIMSSRFRFWDCSTLMWFLDWWETTARKKCDIIPQSEAVNVLLCSLLTKIYNIVVLSSRILGVIVSESWCRERCRISSYFATTNHTLYPVSFRLPLTTTTCLSFPSSSLPTQRHPAPNPPQVAWPGHSTN